MIALRSMAAMFAVLCLGVAAAGLVGMSRPAVPRSAALRLAIALAVGLVLGVGAAAFAIVGFR